MTFQLYVIVKFSSFRSSYTNSIYVQICLHTAIKFYFKQVIYRLTKPNISKDICTYKMKFYFLITLFDGFIQVTT